MRHCWPIWGHNLFSWIDLILPLCSTKMINKYTSTIWLMLYAVYNVWAIKWSNLFSFFFNGMWDICVWIMWYRFTKTFRWKLIAIQKQTCHIIRGYLIQILVLYLMILIYSILKVKFMEIKMFNHIIPMYVFYSIIELFLLLLPYPAKDRAITHLIIN